MSSVVERRGQQDDEHGGDDRLAWLVALGLRREQAAEQRTHGEEHGRDEDERQDDRRGRRPETARAPTIATTIARRLHAVTSSTAAAGDRDLPQMRSGEASLLQDPDEHRERRDAHRDAHEERERKKAGPGRRELRVEKEGQADAQEVRHDDRSVADDHRRPRLVPESLDVELEAHREEKEQDADLREELEQTHRSRREEEREDIRSDGAQKRRTEEDPGDDLSDDGRLADPAEERAQQRAPSERS